MRMRRRELIRAGALLPLGGLIGAARAPESFDWLIGSWLGEGSFFGRPSRATLDAHMAIGERFLEIMWRVETPGEKPVRYEGRGLYRPNADGWDGYWLDSTAKVRPLTAIAETNAFRVNWGTPETERGTSTYLVTGDTLTVEDIVLTAQGPRAFAMHRLKRRRVT